MILRQIGQSPDDKLAKIHESLEKAKEAVNLNIQDGKSWCKYVSSYLLFKIYLSMCDLISFISDEKKYYIWLFKVKRKMFILRLFFFHPLDILGNAYLSLYFTTDQNPNLLKQCLSAYNHAVSCFSF